MSVLQHTRGGRRTAVSPVSAHTTQDQAARHTCAAVTFSPSHVIALPFLLVSWGPQFSSAGCLASPSDPASPPQYSVTSCDTIPIVYVGQTQGQQSLHCVPAYR